MIGARPTEMLAGLGAGIAAATGATAGLLHGAARQTEPSPAYKEFVNRCLGERGYIQYDRLAVSPATRLSARAVRTPRPISDLLF